MIIDASFLFGQMKFTTKKRKKTEIYKITYLSLISESNLLHLIANDVIIGQI
jgi:hypothetical protein